MAAESVLYVLMAVTVVGVLLLTLQALRLARDAWTLEARLVRAQAARNEILFYQKYQQRLDKAQSYVRMAIDPEMATTRAAHQAMVESGLGMMSRSKNLKPYVPIARQVHDSVADVSYAVWSSVKALEKLRKKK